MYGPGRTPVDGGQKSSCGKLAIYDADSQATARLVVGSDSTPSFPASSSMQTRGNAQRHGLPNYPCESAALSARHCGTRNRAIRLPTNRCFRPNGELWVIHAEPIGHCGEAKAALSGLAAHGRSN